jgi:hypothetical protein
MISFSFDKNKQKSLEDIKNLFNKMDLIKTTKTKVGCNLLLDDYILKNIYNFIAEIKKHADYVYLLGPKPNTLLTDIKIMKKKIFTATFLFKNIFVDNSIALRLGLVKSCERGNKIISIDPYGGVSYCSFDKHVCILKKAEDLINFVNTNYPQPKTHECPFL